MSFTRENQLTLEDGYPFNVLQATEGCATESGNVLISFEETLPFVDESGIPSGYALGRTEGQHMGQLNGPLSTRNLQLADLDHVPPGTQMTQPGSGVSEWLSDDWLNIVAQNAPQSSWPPVLNDGNCIFNPLRQHDAVTMAPMTDRQRSQSWWAMSHTVSRGDHIGSRQDDGIANNCADYPAVQDHRNIKSAQLSDSLAVATSSTSRSITSDIILEPNRGPELSYGLSSSPSRKPNHENLERQNGPLVMVWNPEIDEQTVVTPRKNPRTQAERDQTARIRRRGACDDCKRNHRGCKPEHRPSSSAARPRNSASRTRNPSSQARKRARRHVQTSMEDDTAGLGGQFSDSISSSGSGIGLNTEGPERTNARTPSSFMDLDISDIDSF